jgi:hypothetical protein
VGHHQTDVAEQAAAKSLMSVDVIEKAARSRMTW